MGKKKVGNFVLDLDEILGAGQFGKVYKATQQNSDRVVAVKVIDKKKSILFLIQLMKTTTLEMLQFGKWKL